MFKDRVTVLCWEWPSIYLFIFPIDSSIRSNCVALQNTCSRVEERLHLASRRLNESSSANVIESNRTFPWQYSNTSRVVSTTSKYLLKVTPTRIHWFRSWKDRVKTKDLRDERVGWRQSIPNGWLYTECWYARKEYSSTRAVEKNLTMFPADWNNSRWNPTAGSCVRAL